MMLRDLDSETRALVYAARVCASFPSNKALRLLKRQVAAFERKHKQEMDANLWRMLQQHVWGSSEDKVR